LLLGYSHGGVVAQMYAVERPERVRRLVLAVTTARLGPEQRAATQAAIERRSGQPWFEDANAAGQEDADPLTDEQVREELFRRMPFNFARFGPVEAAYLDTWRSEPVNGDALRVFSVDVSSLDLRSRLGDITAPTLVITGEEDYICGPVCAAELSAAIAGAREVIVADAGHLVAIEQPEAFHDEVANFLES
jgi:proline iminopeptidase